MFDQNILSNPCYYDNSNYILSLISIFEHMGKVCNNLIVNFSKHNSIDPFIVKKEVDIIKYRLDEFYRLYSETFEETKFDMEG